uniref:Uncharacterized protein n=1 Tax=Romanomermis culicivorax TaxID=13658 RepID=A0A915IL14_ROMCU
MEKDWFTTLIDLVLSMTVFNLPCACPNAVQNKKLRSLLLASFGAARERCSNHCRALDKSSFDELP